MVEAIFAGNPSRNAQMNFCRSKAQRLRGDLRQHPTPLFPFALCVRESLRSLSIFVILQVHLLNGGVTRAVEDVALLRLADRGIRCFVFCSLRARPHSLKLLSNRYN